MRHGRSDVALPRRPKRDRRQSGPLCDRHRTTARFSLRIHLLESSFGFPDRKGGRFCLGEYGLRLRFAESAHLYSREQAWIRLAILAQDPSGAPIRWSSLLPEAGRTQRLPQMRPEQHKRSSLRAIVAKPSQLLVLGVFHCQSRQIDYLSGARALGAILVHFPGCSKLFVLDVGAK